ncbi:MAG: SIS domain-containing protein [Candidatus Margulisiibacteriota bacterium]
MIHSILNDAAQLHQRLLTDITLQDQIQLISNVCIDALRSGRKIMLCGNGGSFADAQHITAEFVGRFIKERASLPAIALGCNASSTSAIGNDYSFNDVFSREVSSIGQAGDVLIGISTSGNSTNVIQAIQMAQAKNISTFGFTSNKKGNLTNLCPCIEIPSSDTPRVQECHILVGHIICEMVDQVFATND